MTIAGLSSTDFLKILSANGYKVVDDTYILTEGIERAVVGKDGNSFTFRVNYFYPPSEVVKRVAMLGDITIPEEFEVEYGACVNEHEKKMEAIRKLNAQLAKDADTENDS